MSSTIPSSLTPFQSGKKISEYSWKSVSASAAVTIPPEIKAELDARKAASDKLVASSALKIQAPEEPSSNGMFLNNISEIPDEEIEGRITWIQDLIQSGKFERYEFRSANGEQQTSSIHQYLYWLQQRSQELKNDGTYTPDMFK